MAEIDILLKMIFRPGQTQDDRASRELGVHFADVEERTPEALLLFIKKLAAHVRHYPTKTSDPPGDWTPFFPYDETAVKQLPESSSGKISPHLALILAFLELYKEPQDLINRFTGRHLDFYYRDMLRLSKKAAVADRAHVLLELKKNASPVSIGPAHSFSAGKDDTGVERIYVPTGETVIRSAKVDALRSIFLDARGHGAVRYAPVANSSDGTGGALDSEEPKWYGFGHAALPPAEVGFALASPVLRMKEGSRIVTATLTVNHLESSKITPASLVAAFEAFITGEKNWLGPYALSPAIRDGNKLEFEFTIPESESAVTDYNAAVHGYSYTAQEPVLQVLLKSGSDRIGYSDFKGVTIQKAALKVKVSNITSLSLEGDGGTLDPKKAFLPFGPQPTKGARFMVGYTEALAKKLSALKIRVQWKDAPASFSSHYDGYGVSGMGNSYFTATVSFADGGNWNYTNYGVRLFESGNASSEHPFEFKAGAPSVSLPLAEGMKLRALATAGSLWASQAAIKYVRERPVLAPYRRAAPEPRTGFITFTLEKDFLQETYRMKYVENVMKYSKGEVDSLTLLNEPYTPAIQSLSLSYDAHSDEAALASASLTDFSDKDVQFFHIACFGQMREQRYQREQFGFLVDKSIPLLPLYENEGELFIGFKDLKAGDSVSLLFQVAEGSADPGLEQEDIRWFVLCDNYWKPLGANEVVRDTTGQLLTSGIITFVIPSEATTTHTLLPADLIWIKGAVAKQVTTLCQLIEVSANAVEARFTDNGNDPRHLLAALEKNKITRLKNGVSSVKSVKQPFASFGGSPGETDEAFATRVSERLRHKNRCITAWDYERIVLEAFPKVHKVKCIPHAKEGAWLAPGHVLIVVIPDLKNKNAVDPLEPKVDADTIRRITSYVHERAGMQVSVKVKNPSYQKIQLDFKVKFHTGYEFNFYSALLEKELIRFLSPWAYGGDRDISFGGKVYKSVLLDFVEDLNYVDYVTDFKMYSYTGGVNTYVDRNEAAPDTPDAILVSEDTHRIHEGE